MTDQALALLLHAIALVETGGRAHLVGRHGERGAFQMTPAVVAEVGGYGEREAARHVRRIVVALEHANAPTDPFHVALAWNAGIGAVQRGRAPVESYRYAARVRNTYESLSLASTSASARRPEPANARGGGTFFILFP